MKLPRLCHGAAMDLPWYCNGIAMASKYTLNGSVTDKHTGTDEQRLGKHNRPACPDSSTNLDKHTSEKFDRTLGDPILTTNWTNIHHLQDRHVQQIWEVC